MIEENDKISQIYNLVDEIDQKATIDAWYAADALKKIMRTNPIFHKVWNDVANKMLQILYSPSPINGPLRRDIAYDVLHAMQQCGYAVPAVTKMTYEKVLILKEQISIVQEIRNATESWFASGQQVFQHLLRLAELGGYPGTIRENSNADLNGMEEIVRLIGSRDAIPILTAMARKWGGGQWHEYFSLIFVSMGNHPLAIKALDELERNSSHRDRDRVRSIRYPNSNSMWSKEDVEAYCQAHQWMRL